MKVTVVSIYQVCKDTVIYDVGEARAPKSMSACTQQYTMMRLNGAPVNRHPRDQFKMDLRKLLKDFRNKGHELLVMGDFNELFGSSSIALFNMAEECDLLDLMQHRLGTSTFSTCIRNERSNRCIDYALATDHVLRACTAAGYDPFSHLFTSDHRGLFLDFDNDLLFGNPTHKLDSPTLRVIHSKHKLNCCRYIDSRYQYMDDHRMWERLRELIVSSDPFGPEHIAAVERLDRDLLRSAFCGEKECARMRSTPFSAVLASKRRRKNFLYKYILYSRHGVDIGELARRYDGGICLPESVQAAQQEFRALRNEIRKLSREAAQLRREMLQQKIEEATAAGDKAKAKDLKHMRVTEEQRQLNAIVRAENAETNSGVTSLQIPASGDFTKCKECTSWTSIDQPKDIADALH
jgi:hypothetical protein